jgi:hypothetical protein
MPDRPGLAVALGAALVDGHDENSVIILNDRRSVIAAVFYGIRATGISRADQLPATKREKVEQHAWSAFDA